MPDFLHNHKNFKDLLLILEQEKGIVSALLEKDYWIMHVLYGLQKAGFSFELKGGTSLSKGFGIINRFSEDIDIRINPPPELHVNETGSKKSHIASRFEFYDWLSSNLSMEGIIKVERDYNFDSKNGMSGGIRLLYDSVTEKVEGLKSGILLEVGFDQITPNVPVDISSWALDRAISSSNLTFENNTAKAVLCYDMRYTFVEKLQTILTKFRQEEEDGIQRKNYMRQYYDVYCLLQQKAVQDFLHTEDYSRHKEKRFPAKDKVISVTDNEAFLLSSNEKRMQFEKRYYETKSLYYLGQPCFDEILNTIHTWLKYL